MSAPADASVRIEASRKGVVAMLGTIVGDIVGPVYEWHNIKTKDLPLFRDDCFFTDRS